MSDSVITRAYKFRLCPSFEQRVRLWGCAEMARMAWNWTVALCEREYEEALIAAGVLEQRELDGCERRKQRVAVVARARARARENKVVVQSPSINRGRLYKEWCVMRDSTANSIRNYHSHTYSYPIARVVQAYKDWWRKKGGRAGAPRYHRDSHPSSFTIQLSRTVWDDDGIRIPGVGYVRTTWRNRGRWCGESPSAIPPGKPCSITVTRKANAWYASIAMKDVGFDETAGTGVVGLDLGVSSVLTTSDGQSWAPPRPLEKALRRVAILQRRRQRKPKRSRRRTLLDIQIASLHARVAAIRYDHLHNVSTHLAKTFGVVVVEGFDVVGLVSNEVQWRAIRRAMMDIAWGELRRQLEYKLQWRGGTLMTMGVFDPTNQQCASCWKTGTVTMNACPPSQAIYRCSTCDAKVSRQMNTAKLLELFGRFGPPPQQGTGAQPGPRPPRRRGKGHARGGAESTACSAAPVKREQTLHAPPQGASPGARALLARTVSDGCTQDGGSATPNPSCNKPQRKPLVRAREQGNSEPVAAEVQEGV